MSALVAALADTTKRTVLIGTAPINLLQQVPMEDAVVNEPARIALKRIIRSTGKGLSWRLFYDVGLQLHVLNIHRVN